MFLRRSLAHISFMYVIFGVHLGVLPPPPNTKKLATLLEKLQMCSWHREGYICRL